MYRSLPALVALALCASCNYASGSVGGKSSSVAAPSPPTTAIIALDTSTSAKDIHEMLYKKVLQDMENLDPSTNLVVFRFDSSPAEIYDGKAIVDDAQAGTLLNSELKWKSKTSGTNLAKLFSRIDKRVRQTAGTIRVDVYTDAGTENMTTEEDAQATSIAQSWKIRGGTTLAFHGVRSGFRERIRDLVPYPVTID